MVDAASFRLFHTSATCAPDGMHSSSRHAASCLQCLIHAPFNKCIITIALMCVTNIIKIKIGNFPAVSVKMGKHTNVIRYDTYEILKSEGGKF